MSDPILKALLGSSLGIQTAAESSQVAGWLDTGNLALNWAISSRFSRGYPVGHVGEIYGDPSTGKSFLIARAIAMVQKAGGVALLDDAEGVFNADWATVLGIDIDKLTRKNSSTVKEHFELAKKFLEIVGANPQTAPCLLLLDSLAILTTDHEKKVGLEKPSMVKAKEVRAMYRLLSTPLSHANVVYLSANHTIASMDAFAPPESSGGGGLKFQASVRLHLGQPSKIKAEGGDFLGVKTAVMVQKNRLSRPHRRINIAIPFDQPISPFSGLLPVLMNEDIVSTSKGHTIIYQETDTKIKAHKTDFLKQENSAVQLVRQYPALLKDADAAVAAQPVVIPLSVEEVTRVQEEG